MKKLYSLFLLMIAVGFTSCELDNYEAPNINLTGRVVYNGEPINVRNNEVIIRLYEPGWELSSSTYMNVNVEQDGSFSAGVYAGKSYKLVRQANIGPWVNPTAADTVDVNNYNGGMVDIEVVPYYLLDNVEIRASGRMVNATCTIREVTPNTIERVGLYVCRNIIVDNTHNMGGAAVVETTVDASGAALAGNGQTVSLQADLSGFSVNSTNESIPQTGIVFARMGLKIQGIDTMVYSKPVELRVTAE